MNNLDSAPRGYDVKSRYSLSERRGQWASQVRTMKSRDIKELREVKQYDTQSRCPVSQARASLPLGGASHCQHCLLRKVILSLLLGFPKVQPSKASQRAQSRARSTPDDGSWESAVKARAQTDLPLCPSQLCVLCVRNSIIDEGGGGTEKSLRKDFLPRKEEAKMHSLGSNCTDRVWTENIVHASVTLVFCPLEQYSKQVKQAFLPSAISVDNESEWDAR